MTCEGCGEAIRHDMDGYTCATCRISAHIACEPPVHDAAGESYCCEECRSAPEADTGKSSAPQRETGTTSNGPARKEN